LAVSSESDADPIGATAIEMMLNSKLIPNTKKLEIIAFTSESLSILL